MALTIILNKRTIKDKGLYLAYLQCLLFLVLFLSSCAVDRSKYLRVYSSDYYGLCGIELGMVDGSHIEAFIYSHDFVGHRSDVYEGTYAYNPPFITVRWDDKNADVDIRYMIYDENNDRIIAYGQDGIYYLSNENKEKRIEHDRIEYVWKSLDNNIDMDTCDYYILEKNSFTNEYVTDRQELLLPDGYHISYNQILANMLKQTGHEDGYGEALVFDDSYDILNYEDDTLKIVFERMCIGFWKDPNGKPRNSIRDYSVVPKIIYDKRKQKSPLP
ncbi:MAG: hypothetical protein IKT00_02720 [Prevotella sp.]|nr:hypothetical protein [Prevotella sp.]